MSRSRLEEIFSRSNCKVVWPKLGATRWGFAASFCFEMSNLTASTGLALLVAKQAKIDQPRVCAQRLGIVPWARHVITSEWMHAVYFALGAAHSYLLVPSSLEMFKKLDWRWIAPVVARNIATIYVTYAASHWLFYSRKVWFGSTMRRAYPNQVVPVEKKYNKRMPNQAQISRDRFWTLAASLITAGFEIAYLHGSARGWLPAFRPLSEV